MKKTLKQLLAWAKGRCYIEIYKYGYTCINMQCDDSDTQYDGDTLYVALLKAYKAEKELK